MELHVKKTSDLTPLEKHQICDLYDNVFKKVKRSDEFERQFSGTFLGYSYHALLADRNSLVGSWSFIPYRYSYFGDILTFVLSVDTMLDRQYRGKSGTLTTMAERSYEIMRGDNIHFVLGFPNDKFYPITRKVLGWNDIGKLDFYMLPIRVGAIKPTLSPFNVISKWFVRILNRIPNDINAYADILAETQDPYPIHKITDAVFFAHRYDSSYSLIKFQDSNFFVYRLYKEETIRAAYILDFSPYQKKYLESAVKSIYEREKNNIDVIIYIGKLKYTPVNLFKVPGRFQPKQVNMCGKIIRNDKIDEKIFQIDNWNVNLSNFDVR